MKGAIHVLVFSLLFLSTIQAQESGIPLAYRQRVAILYQKIQTEIIPLPLQDAACPLSKLQNELTEAPANTPNFEKWWATLNQLRDNGNADCCYQMLDELEPYAHKDQATYLKWLYSKSGILSAFQLKDSALVVAQQLKIAANRSMQFQGWAAFAEAKIYFDQQDYHKTFNLAAFALNFARKKRDKKLEGKALSLIGSTSRALYIKRPEKNVSFHKKALRIAESLQDTSAMIAELLLIGVSYDLGPKFDKLFDYTEAAIALIGPNTSLKNRMNCLRYLAVYLSRVKDFDRSLTLYATTISYLKKLNNQRLIQSAYHQSADVYVQQADLEKNPRKYNQALAMLDTAMVYAREDFYLYHRYAYILERKGDARQAMKYYRMAFSEQEKNYFNSNSSLLTQMETRLRTHETEILLEQRNRQRWQLFGIMALLAILLGGSAYAYWITRKFAKKILHQKELIEKQAGELRHLDELKNRFYANVSHELRTPLTLILGPLASTLKRNRLEPADVSYLKIAQTHSRQLLNLVNEILDLSKLEAYKMELQETTVGFQTCMRRLISAFESHAERLNIHFEFEYHPENQLRLLLDTDKLTKVVNNLLSNALKFTQPGGTVKVVVEASDEVICISVRDNGRGIHHEDLPSVFDRFYQSSRPEVSVEGGTGIGLALCRELAAVMKGRVWVESTLGQGSCFFFEFPKKEATAPVNEETELINADGENTPEDQELGTQSELLTPQQSLSKPIMSHQATLLIVEDNPDLRAYTASMLRSANYHILEANHGAEALIILTDAQTTPTTSIDLIISDIMMPVMDGFQLLKTLKDQDAFRAIPVIMLTARADLRDKLSALRIGVDDYLLKPFEEQELLARVENLLNNHQNRMARKTGNKPKEGIDTPTPRNTKLIVSQKDQEWLHELETVVAEAMPNSDFNAERVAEQLFMSRSRLFYKVKKLTGITFNEYVQEMRLSLARTGLENRLYTTVKEIVHSVGFKDVRYFSELFRKRFGSLPSDYFK